MFRKVRVAQNESCHNPSYPTLIDNLQRGFPPRFVYRSQPGRLDPIFLALQLDHAHGRSTECQDSVFDASGELSTGHPACVFLVPELVQVIRVKTAVQTSSF